MKKHFKKTLWLSVGIMAAIATYIILYQPDQLVDPSFHDVSTKTQIVNTSAKQVKAVNTTPTPTKASITPVVTAKAKTTAPVSTPAPTTTTPAAPVTASSTSTDCAPTATVEDPCKLGQCFGYPYGICESNPNQGEDNKEQVADPNGPTYDLWGNEFTDTGTLIQASSEQVDPVSGEVNPYYVGN